MIFPEYCIDGVWYRAGIMDHRPLLTRLRVLASQSPMLTLSKGINDIIEPFSVLEQAADQGAFKIKFVDFKKLRAKQRLD